jgi:hypothetical protein
MRLSLFLAIAATCEVAAGPDAIPRFRAVGDTRIPLYRFEAVPVWSGDSVVAIEHNRTSAPVVRIFGEDGVQINAIAIEIPGANYIEVRRAAHGGDGATAICGAARDGDGHIAGFLALVSARGQIQRLVRTEPYSPTAVTIAPDGTIWMKGAEYVPVKRVPSKTNAGIIRHLDASGKELGAYLPQSDLTWHQLFLGIDRLVANSRRVGWYNGQGAITYFEVVDGRIERYPAVPLENIETDEISGLAITDDDQVFVTRSVRGDYPELLVLDRASRSWNSVATPRAGPPETTSWLIGGGGKTLVFKTVEQSNWLRRFEVLSK